VVDEVLDAVAFCHSAKIIRHAMKSAVGGTFFFQKTTHTLCALSRGRAEGVNDYLLVVIVVVEKEYYNYIISILSLAYIYIITSLLCPESGVWCPRKWVSEPRKWGFEHGKWGLHPKKWVSEPKKWVSLLEKFMSYQHSKWELSTFRN
jgi:hypothetical protein